MCASKDRHLSEFWVSLVAQTVKNLPLMQETQVWSQGRKDPLEKGTVIHSSILAWRIPWTEEPGGLQSMGSQRLRHDWVTNTHLLSTQGDDGPRASFLPNTTSQTQFSIIKYDSGHLKKKKKKSFLSLIIKAETFWKKKNNGVKEARISHNTISWLKPRINVLHYFQFYLFLEK